MAKEIKLKVSIDGAGKVTADVDDIGEALHHLDVVDAKNAKQALDSLDKTTLNRLKSEIKIASATVKEFGNQIKNTGQTIQNFGQTATVAITAPIVAMATFGITSQATLEKAEVSFARFIKNSKGFAGSLDDAKVAAKGLMKELNEFADTTPFESEEVIASGRKLLAAKIPKEEIKSFLVDAGDLAAAANASIEDVAAAMSRLKSGDFGEAFERFRDFGISKEDLTEKGLKFDGSGQFQGSAEEAMNAVRAIIKERFGSTMEDLSQTMSGRFSTLMDKGKAFFRELFMPAFEYAKPAIDFVVAQLQVLTAYLTQLSPQTKLVIVSILGFLAALGPVAVVVGTLVVGIGSLVTAIGTIAGALAGVSLAPILAGIGAVILVLAEIGVAIYALYLAWQTNFGNIQNIVAEFQAIALASFESLKSLAIPIVEEIANFVTEGFNKIKDWWAENGQDISKAAEVVFNNLLNAVKLITDSIAALWATHGEDIKAITSEIWEIIKSIISGAVEIVGKMITIVAALINGDWAKAWNDASDIVSVFIRVTETILKGAGNIFFAALKASFVQMLSIHTWITTEAHNLGENIGKGLYNGLANWVDPIGAIGRKLGKMATEYIGIGAETQSPSKATTRIGEWISEGLANGIENRAVMVKTKAKKLADDTIKLFKDAIKEFEKLAGASPEQVQRIQQSDRVKDATNAQSEIIKLRKETGLNDWKPLPKTVTETEAELRYLQAQKKAADDYVKSLEEIGENVTKTKEMWAEEKEAAEKAFETRKRNLEQSGVDEVLRLQEEIELLGVTDEMEKLRIQNAYELKKLREDLMNDGFEKDQIDEIIKIQKAEQARILELSKIKFDKDKVLDEQKKQAEEAKKAAEEAKRQVEQVYEDLSGSIQRILSAGVRGGFREGLGAAWDELKNFGQRILDGFLKKISDNITKRILDPIFGTSSSGNTSGFAGGGGYTGGNFPTNPFTGGVGIPLGLNFGGGSAGTRTGDLDANGVMQVFSGDKGRGDFLSNIKNLFSTKDGGIFAPQKNVLNGSTSKTAGVMSGIGQIATMVGGFLPGTAGNVLSMAGTGMSIGAMFGPWGAAIGAGVGALVGLFMGDPKKKRDQKEKIPALNQGFTDSFTEFQKIVQDTKNFRLDSDEALNKARELRTQIATGFGIQFESKKYQKESQKLIQAKLAEIDRINNDDPRNGGLMQQVEYWAERARNAGERDRRMIAEFATGVYMSPSFASQYGDFKRRNGMLQGQFTGRDTLPSMLAMGEMVLNPNQIARIKMNAGFDVFKGAGIPGYANGVYVTPTATPTQTISPNAPVFQPKITIVLNNSGMVESDISEILVNDLKDPDVQVELVKAYDKGKSRTR